jgi:hypothetical protein
VGEMYLEHYLKELGYPNIPEFLIKYLECPSLIRLKKVGYFCGMDYASKDIYDFREYISRYDHSLTVSLLVYKLTKNKKETLAGLFHDVGTPSFSHVIDYMNKDYEYQESTEEFTEKIIMSDDYLLTCLKEDDISPDEIINFKRYSVVDNNRPKVCADRIDGVILTGIGWTKNISKDDISRIVSDLSLYKNEDGEDEIGFSKLEVAKRVLEISESIDEYCHSIEDNYMMELLAIITRLAIDRGYITYDNLYYFDEEKIFSILNEIDDLELQSLLIKFKTIKKEEIELIELPPIKKRKLNPIVSRKRIRIDNSTSS